MAHGDDSGLDVQHPEPPHSRLCAELRHGRLELGVASGKHGSEAFGALPGRQLLNALKQSPSFIFSHARGVRQEAAGQRLVPDGGKIGDGQVFDGLAMDHVEPAFAHQSIGGILEELSPEPVVRPVGDHHPVQGLEQLFAEPGPGLRPLGQKALGAGVLLAGPRVGHGLEQAAVHDPDKGGVAGVVAVVVAVLGGQPPLVGQQRGQPARRDPDLPGVANAAEVLLGHAREIGGVVELPGQEVGLFGVVALHGLGSEPPALVAGKLGRAFQDGVPVIAARRCAEGLPGSFAAFVAVGAPQTDRAVGQAVVQGPRKGQDVLDLHVLGEQPTQGNDLPGVDASPVGGVAAQFLPQLHALDGVAGRVVDALGAHDPQPVVVTQLVFALALCDFLPPLPAVFQLPGHLHHNLLWMAVYLDDGVDHTAKLVQADMQRGVGDPAKAVGRRVFGVVGPEADVPIQNLSIVGQTVQYLSGREMRMMDVARTHDRLGKRYDAALQFGRDLAQRRRPETDPSVGQGRARGGQSGLLVEAEALLQHLYEPLLVFCLQQQLHQFFAIRQRERRPTLFAHDLERREHACDFVPFESRARGRFQVEPPPAIETKCFSHAVERHGLLLEQLLKQQVAMLQGQYMLPVIRAYQPKIVEFLQNTESLCRRQRSRRPLLVFVQNALAARDRLERPLEKQDITDFIQCCGVETAVKTRLPLPEKIQFLGDQAAVGVDVIERIGARALPPGPDPLPLFAPHVEQIPEGLGAIVFHLLQ